MEAEPMLQQFRRRTLPETGPARLARLRAAMAAAGVDAFLVPRADAHQGETVAPRDERLAWLSGFTGSAGFAAVTAARAVVFVDGRYRLQVTAEVDAGSFEVGRHPEETLSDWLADTLDAGATVGFDPWLHTAGEVEGLETALAAREIGLRRVDNLVDAVWDDQPAPPVGPMRVHPEALAGRSATDKLAQIADELRSRGVGAAVLTLPDSIAWLLNVRGSDIAHTPVPLAFAVVRDTGAVALFTDPAKIDAAVAAHFGEAVRVAPRDDFGPALDALGGKVSVDKASAPVWVADRLRAAGAEVVWARDPCVLPKATKTAAELDGAREAHRRDGAAMVEFLAWLDEQAPGGGLDEITVVGRLEGFRRATNALRDIAFDTICGAGPNGAIVHYRVSEATNRRIAPGDILLVDSGAQYEDGTTDVTRTVAVGPVDPAAVRPFTLVLKGMIGMSRLRWPEGLAGRDIDSVARLALWSAGFDYDHGTGHGVGSYLGVHEGPAGLSKRSVEPIRPGMILSNEPGYYREGAFGIRIENLVAVTPGEVPEGGDRPMLGFETLTLVPIDRRLVDPGLLGADEIAWLDAYHARVLATIGPRVSETAAAWLARACAPIG